MPPTAWPAVRVGVDRRAAGPRRRRCRRPWRRRRGSSRTPSSRRGRRRRRRRRRPGRSRRRRPRRRGAGCASSSPRRRRGRPRWSWSRPSSWSRRRGRRGGRGGRRGGVVVVAAARGEGQRAGDRQGEQGAAHGWAPHEVGCVGVEGGDQLADELAGARPEAVQVLVLEGDDAAVGGGRRPVDAGRGEQAVDAADRLEAGRRHEEHVGRLLDDRLDRELGVVDDAHLGAGVGAAGGGDHGVDAAALAERQLDVGAAQVEGEDLRPAGGGDGGVGPLPRPRRAGRRAWRRAPRRARARRARRRRRGSCAAGASIVSSSGSARRAPRPPRAGRGPRAARRCRRRARRWGRGRGSSRRRACAGSRSSASAGPPPGTSPRCRWPRPGRRARGRRRPRRGRR